MRDERKASNMAKLTSEQEQLLKGKNFAHLATIRDDGTPQVTPVWVDYDGEYVLINTGQGRAKDRHMRRDPRVTLEVSDQENPYTYVAISGNAEIVDEGERAWEHINDLHEKYHGTREYPSREPQRVLYRVKPERIG
jgi:PPOX class probable F420-dependent enzyme